MPPSGRRDTRKPGRPALLDRERILAAARDLDPAKITMQAVATRLDVDPTALNYHVGGREGLLSLVAQDTFKRHTAAQAAAVAEDWRGAVRVFGRMAREGTIRTGALAHYLRLDSESGIIMLTSAEVVIESMIAAGFSEVIAVRGVGFVADFAFASARNAILAAGNGTHPVSAELRRAFTALDAPDLPALRRILKNHHDGFGEAQFEFELEVFINGMERLLPDGR